MNGTVSGNVRFCLSSSSSSSPNYYKFDFRLLVLCSVVYYDMLFIITGWSSDKPSKGAIERAQCLTRAHSEKKNESESKCDPLGSLLQDRLCVFKDVASNVVDPPCFLYDSLLLAPILCSTFPNLLPTPCFHIIRTGSYRSSYILTIIYSCLPSFLLLLCFSPCLWVSYRFIQPAVSYHVKGIGLSVLLVPFSE